jgi:deoxycytidylate deaminase
MKIRNITQYLLLADELLLKSPCRSKVGVVLFRKNKILETGYNFYDKKVLVHAEIYVIKKALENGKNLLGARLAISSNTQNYKTCFSCLKLIRESGIKRLFYSKDKVFVVKNTELDCKIAEKYISVTDSLAQLSSYRYKIGALLLKRNNIIGTGYNQKTSNIPHVLYNTHPNSSRDNSIHAEVAAILSATKNGHAINGSTMVVSGFTNGKNRPISCCPCNSCIKILQKYGIRKLVYTTNDGVEIKYLKDF